MGGHALVLGGQPVTTRLPKILYENVKEFVLRTLSAHPAVKMCEVVRELPGKADFGDVDVLYVCRDTTNHGESGSAKNPEEGPTVATLIAPEVLIHEAFPPPHATCWVTNGTVTSFDFDCSVVGGAAGVRFQVDLIRVSSQEHLNCTRFYFSYGDVGGILGRLVNYYGLKIGEDGLWLELLAHTVNPNVALDVRTTLGKVHLTRDPQRICEFLGLDYDTWDRVFPTLTSSQDEQQLMAWLAGCKWFSPHIFCHLNNDHRRRERVRPFLSPLSRLYWRRPCGGVSVFTEWRIAARKKPPKGSGIVVPLRRSGCGSCGQNDQKKGAP